MVWWSPARRGALAVVALLGGAVLGASPALARSPLRATILTGPADRVATRQAVFSFMGSGGARLRFSYRLDRSRWTRFHSGDHVRLKSLRVGRHVFRLRVRDARGRISPVVAGVFVVDRRAPQTRILTGYLDGSVVSRGRALRFASSERGSTFECSVDRGAFAPCATPYALDRLAVGTHRIAVRAVDGAGNRDATPVAMTLSVATQRAFSAAPLDLATGLFSDDFESGTLARWTVTKGGDGTATVVADAAATGAFGARFTESATSTSLADARAALPAPTANLSLSENARVTAEGTTSSTSVPLVRLFDSAGTRLVNVYRQNVTGKLWVQHGGTYASTAKVVALGTWVRIGLHVVAAGASASTVELTADGATIFSTTTSSLTTAPKTVQIGNDSKGQIGSVDVDDVSASQAATDTTPPDTTILTGPAGTITTSTGTFTFSASEPGSTFQCNLDGAAFAACSSPSGVGGLVNGPHTFQVRAVDAAGNVDPTPASRSFTVNVAGSSGPKLLIADNLGKRIWITDFNGNPVWKCANPLGDALTYSGPLGVRWMANGHILATFGTGVVGEIDPTKPCPGFPGSAGYNAANVPFVWTYRGPAGDGFQSPYDAVVLPDGNLAVALRFNQLDGGEGKVAVYTRRLSGAAAIQWQRHIPDAHSVEYIPAGQGYQTALPELLGGGFGGLEEVTYQPGQPQQVTWSGPSEFTHRAIVDSSDDLVTSEGYYLHRIDRTGHELWRQQLKRTNGQNIEWRGIAEDPATGGFVVSQFTDGQVWFFSRDGVLQKKWGLYNVNDGGPYTYMKFPYGLRIISYP